MEKYSTKKKTILCKKYMRRQEGAGSRPRPRTYILREEFSRATCPNKTILPYMSSWIVGLGGRNDFAHTNKKERKTRFHVCYQSIPCLVLIASFLSYVVDSCMDKDGNCPVWKEYGSCQTHPDVMKEHCQYSCNLCNGKIWNGLYSAVSTDNAYVTYITVINLAYSVSMPRAKWAS